MSDEIQRTVDRVVREVVGLCLNQEDRTDSTNVLLAFLSRVAGSYESVCTLVDHTSSQDHLDARSNDCATILRCMYEAYVQAAYIATGGKEKEPRARSYIEYEHVEQYRQRKKILPQKNRMARVVANSPRREAAEPLKMREYNRVKSNYPNPFHWYSGSPTRSGTTPGSLSDLAKEIGKSDEYAWLVDLFHTSVHSGPVATFRGPFVKRAEDFRAIALRSLARVAGLVVDNDSLKVSAYAKALIAVGDKNIWEAYGSEDA